MTGLIVAAITGFCVLGIARVMWLDGAKLPALGACCSAVFLFYVGYLAAGCGA